MNNLGIITGLLKIMLAAVFIILALALAGPGRHFIEITKNTTILDTNETGNPTGVNVSQIGLNCVNITGQENTTLNDFQKVNCIAVDLINPLFILTIIGLAGVIVAARILFGR